MLTHIPHTLDVIEAAPPARPIVMDSPHSGTDYPEDFDYACPLPWLRQMEDTHVDRLFGFAPALGIRMLRAHFPRSYCDANRAADDWDPLLVEGMDTRRAVVSEKSRQGAGLVHRICRPGVAIYGRKLTKQEMEHRLRRCWHPYHEALSALLREAQAQHAAVLLVNVHSMASTARTSIGGPLETDPRPDVALGDRDGTTCAPALMARLIELFRGQGFRVGVNKPYRGAEIVRRHSDPAHGRHAIQIEIRRNLYMDEDTLIPHAGFATLQAALQSIFGQLAAEIEPRLPRPGENAGALPLAAE